MSSAIYIGLMSGTSADSLDAVAVDFAGPALQILAVLDYPLPEDFKQRVQALADPMLDDIDLLGEMDREIGYHSAHAVHALLEKACLQSSDIQAIGSHGQTVRHRPSGRGRQTNKAFTLQLGDPNTIAENTGITTIADFRRRDIAAGGQGAPLVPAFHSAVFRSAEYGRVIVNIGGMANISLLPLHGATGGYDTGPGNVLLDDWMQYQLGTSMDRDGELALSGSCDQVLLNSLFTNPFFQLPPPRSTGRETFGLAWLQQKLHSHGRPLATTDILATLVELTAASISLEIDRSGCAIDEILVCGGGAFNPAIMGALGRHNPNRSLSDTNRLGIPPQWVEACAFAWLARQRLCQLPGNCPAVTGASKSVVLGAIYPA